jgi:multiple sugar transport system ATP-binding protein
MQGFDRQSAVRFENVEKSFGDVKVLKDFDLEVQPGEFVVLLGASGSGKTTALRILSGLEKPSGGQVYIDEENVTDVLPKYRDISMVFQSYALYPHKTVADNISFPLKVRGMAKLDRDAATLNAAKQVQIEDLLDRYPRELSGGQRQRVALARAIIRQPSVFSWMNHYRTLMPNFAGTCERSSNTCKNPWGLQRFMLPMTKSKQ